VAGGLRNFPKYDVINGWGWGGDVLADFQ